MCPKSLPYWICFCVLAVRGSPTPCTSRTAAVGDACRMAGAGPPVTGPSGSPGSRTARRSAPRCTPPGRNGFLPDTGRTEGEGNDTSRMGSGKEGKYEHRQGGKGTAMGCKAHSPYQEDPNGNLQQRTLRKVPQKGSMQKRTARIIFR